MAQERPLRILTINSGSSSIKIALYQMERAETLILTGSIERIGLKGGLFCLVNGQGDSMVDQQLDLPDHDAAFKALLEWLQGHDALGQAIDAVGHRLVHGGREYSHPHLVSPELVAALKEFVPLAELKDLEFGGWDIFKDNVYEAALNAKVLKENETA